MRSLKALTLVAVVLAVACPLVRAQYKPDDPVKWSQWVDTDVVTGWDVPSYWIDDLYPAPVVVVADDWRCLDGLPVTDFHWWGSYPAGEPGAVQVFEISIHADIPASGGDCGVPSHPGQLLWNTFAVVGDNVGQVQEMLFDSQTPPAHDIFQYNYKIDDPADYFNQEQGEIYWLNIVAITGDNDTIWGWHTAIRPAPENGLDAAVGIYDYNPFTGEYTRWGALYDGYPDYPCVQMAFELTTIPEPASLALMGSVGLTLVGLIRRRRLSRK